MFKIICLLLCLSFTLSAKPDCNKLVKSAEKCLKTTLRLDTFNVPKNIDEYNQYNRDFVKSVKCMRAFRVCLKGLARQTFGLIMAGLVKHGKYMFGKQSNATAMIYSSHCLTPKILKSTNEKLYLLSARIQYTLKDAKSFDEGCCAIRMMEEEIMALINKDSCKVALNEGRTFVRRMIDAFTEDASNLLCSKHSSVKVCDKEYPTAMAALRAVDLKKYRTDEFVVRPLLRMITKLTE